MSGVRDILQNRDLFHVEENDTVASVVRPHFLSPPSSVGITERPMAVRLVFPQVVSIWGELPPEQPVKTDGLRQRSASAGAEAVVNSPCLLRCRSICNAAKLSGAAPPRNVQSQSSR